MVVLASDANGSLHFFDVLWRQVQHRKTAQHILTAYNPAVTLVLFLSASNIHESAG
jgi:hypothetical protein